MHAVTTCKNSPDDPKALVVAMLEARIERLQVLLGTARKDTRGMVTLRALGRPGVPPICLSPEEAITELNRYIEKLSANLPKNPR
jgi:hypothetical protein